MVYIDVGLVFAGTELQLPLSQYRNDKTIDH